VKSLRYFLLFSFFALPMTNAFSQSNSFEFMTPRDLLESNSPSNINLQNNRSTNANVYGLYVRQFSYVTPGNSCDTATVIYSTTTNTTAGAFVSPVTINAGKSAALGSNFLYNMIYQANYYVNIIFPSSPPGCALPGCTWGSDTTPYNWCIYLGAIAPITHTSDYTSNVPPSTDLASSSGNYDYNLISSFNYLGPISCNDRTLTCSVVNQQTQSFS
jgi:hypothetical protein